MNHVPPAGDLRYWKGAVYRALSPIMIRVIGEVGGSNRSHRGRHSMLFNPRGHRGIEPRLHNSLRLRRQKNIQREIILKTSVAHGLPRREPGHHVKPPETRLPAGGGISRAVNQIQYVGTVLAQPT